MISKDRRTVDERRNWLSRLAHVSNVIKHIEKVDRSNLDIDTLAESLNLSPCIINRIFFEIKNDYSHRFPWLSETVE